MKVYQWEIHTYTYMYTYIYIFWIPLENGLSHGPSHELPLDLNLPSCWHLNIWGSGAAVPLTGTHRHAHAFEISPVAGPESSCFSVASTLERQGSSNPPISSCSCGLALRYRLGPHTESQNHRMVEAGRDLWRPSGPILLLKQGQLELVTQDHVLTAFEYDSTASVGNLC